MTLPLTWWQLHADALPGGMDTEPAGFCLPGVKGLDAFADLLGGEDTPQAQPSAGVPFSLPARLPDGTEGTAELTREIDFGSLTGDFAALTLDSYAGRGEILLGGECIARFDSSRPGAQAQQDAHALTAMPCALAVDLTDALQSGRRETLSIRFGPSRPAGAGAAMLVCARYAHLSHVSLAGDAARRVMTLRARVHARRGGAYVLRVRFVPVTAGAPVPAAREVSLSLDAGQTLPVQLSFEADAPQFTPGMPYAAPAVKVQLLYLPQDRRHVQTLCDGATLLCGYAGSSARSYVPLSGADCALSPDVLTEKLASMHISAVSFAAPAPDSLCRALCRAGVAVYQPLPSDHPLRDTLSHLPNIVFGASPDSAAVESPEMTAWQLCGMTAGRRAVYEPLSPAQLLQEASGRTLNPSDPHVADVLTWLRAFSVRLRAEAARQQRYAGALCAPADPDMPDVADALRTALAPMHLSALPLCGAWWTGTHFSASLELFAPDRSADGLCARAALEDADGHTLAQLSSPCPAGGGYIGVLETALPDHPCVLELTTQLLRGKEVVEQSVLPVYVGERGPLEAAF